MKFAVLALLGVKASTVNVPTISWDQTKLSSIGGDVGKWERENQRDTQANDMTAWDDFTRAWAAFEVGSYTNYGRTMAPIAAQEVEFYDKITPGTTCNTEAATTCVDTFLHGRMTHMDKMTMETCVKTTAKCNTKWDDMTDAQQ
jgi:hypothetical protein